MAAERRSHDAHFVRGICRKRPYPAMKGIGEDGGRLFNFDCVELGPGKVGQCKQRWPLDRATSRLGAEFPHRYLQREQLAASVKADERAARLKRALRL